MPRTLAPVCCLITSASMAASPPSWTWPKPSVAEVLASETKRAVGIMDALGHSDEYLAVLLIQCVDVR